MKQYRLEATPAVELDIEATFNWYEREEDGLGFVFLTQLRDAYVKILDHPSDIKSYAPAFAVLSQNNFHMRFTFQSKVMWWLFSRCFTRLAIPQRGSDGSERRPQTQIWENAKKAS